MMILRPQQTVEQRNLQAGSNEARLRQFRLLREAMNAGTSSLRSSIRPAVLSAACLRPSATSQFGNLFRSRS
jgi:hypothetical protein